MPRRSQGGKRADIGQFQNSVDDRRVPADKTKHREDDQDYDKHDGPQKDPLACRDLRHIRLPDGRTELQGYWARKTDTGLTRAARRAGNHPATAPTITITRTVTRNTATSPDGSRSVVADSRAPP